MVRPLKLALLLLIALPAGAQETPTQGPAKVIQPSDWVWVDYAVWLENGQLFDTTTSRRNPLRLKHGDGTVPGVVEQAMLGMAVDDHKTLRVGPEQGYGPVQESLYESVPLDEIPESAREAGHQLVMKDEQGRQHAVRVHRVEEDHVVLDRNHPLAGQTLTFDFRIVEIYTAPPAEN